MIRLFAFALLLVFGATGQAAAEAAWCVYGKTTVESWDAGQMRVRYGSSACSLGGGSDGRKFLERNYGGTGKPCQC